jgi:hypothetical protein
MATSKPPRRHVRKRIRKPIESDDQLVETCKEINLYWDVEARLARYESAAGAVLQEAGLPMADDLYRYQSDKSPPWRRFDVNEKIDGHFMRLVELVEAQGYDCESREGYAARVMIAFADPLFSKEAYAEATSKHVTIRSLPSFYRGAQLDVRSLAESLPQLPGTRAEVETIFYKSHPKRVPKARFSRTQ